MEEYFAKPKNEIYADHFDILFQVIGELYIQRLLLQKRIEADMEFIKNRNKNEEK